MEYVWLPTPSGIAIPLALIKNQHAFAIYSDHLHTPRIVTNAQQEIVWRWDYSGFGEIAAQATTIKQNTNPTNQAPKSLEVNLRYPGQYFDLESGLHYNWHRSYDQHTGRYTQADPIGLNGGWNRFGYANANALGFVDPEGLTPLVIPGICAAGGCEAIVTGTMCVATPACRQAVGNAFGSAWKATVQAANAGAKAIGNACKPLFSSSTVPGTWPADKGAEEWGRRTGHGIREGRGRFHRIKGANNGRPTDDYRVDPETGDVYDPSGEYVDNLNEVKPR